ncbi:MAG TPA: peptidoglycan-binding domain-containing protein, partial [Planctomycetota bacterium]|nr:peptidoglycan-binding domain-containing protein [Planctomycetota bacterium]
GQDAQGEQSLSPPVGEQFVRNVQDKLRAKGIDAGPVDGIWGPRTHAGLREFQQKQGLDATGQLNAPTLEALGIPGEAQAAAGQSGR